MSLLKVDAVSNRDVAQPLAVEKPDVTGGIETPIDHGQLSGALELDPKKSNLQIFEPTGAVTLTIAAGHASKGHGMTIYIKNGSTNVTWPVTGWKWNDDGSAPGLRATGVDIIEALSIDGTNWIAWHIGGHA